jgi:hypothetical protein
VSFVTAKKPRIQAANDRSAFNFSLKVRALFWFSLGCPMGHLHNKCTDAMAQYSNTKKLSHAMWASAPLLIWRGDYKG